MTSAIQAFVVPTEAYLLIQINGKNKVECGLLNNNPRLYRVFKIKGRDMFVDMVKIVHSLIINSDKIGFHNFYCPCELGKKFVVGLF